MANGWYIVLHSTLYKIYAKSLKSLHTAFQSGFIIFPLFVIGQFLCGNGREDYFQDAQKSGLLTLLLQCITMTDLEQYLHTYFAFDGSDLATVASFFKPEMVRKGDFYLQTGKPCNKLSFIQSGILRIFVDLEDREVTQWISTKGYFITDLSGLIFEKPSRWNMQALTDTILYSIDKADYDRLGDFIQKWPVTEKLFLAHCFVTLEERVFSFLSMTAEQRYNLLFDSHRELFNQVPLQYIASMLGMTPETISRIRRKQLH